MDPRLMKKGGISFKSTSCPQVAGIYLL